MKTPSITPNGSGCSPSDLILAYTDGVVEAVDVHQNLYTNDRLVTTVQGAPANSAEGLVKSVMASVTSFSQGVPQADDITVLALRFKGYKGLKVRLHDLRHTLPPTS